MINANDLRSGTTFLWQGRPCLVLNFEHIKIGRGGAVVKLKVKDLTSGAIFDQSLKNNDRVDQAPVEKRPATFLYQDERELFFMDSQSFESVGLPINQAGRLADFLVEGLSVELQFFNGRPISVLAPKKVELLVKETSPQVRGGTVANVTKPARLESGATIKVPAFIEIGDRVKINTETGQYVERAR